MYNRMHHARNKGQNRNFFLWKEHQQLTFKTRNKRLILLKVLKNYRSIKSFQNKIVSKIVRLIVLCNLNIRLNLKYGIKALDCNRNLTCSMNHYLLLASHTFAAYSSITLTQLFILWMWHRISAN